MKLQEICPRRTQLHPAQAHPILPFLQQLRRLPRRRLRRLRLSLQRYLSRQLHRLQRLQLRQNPQPQSRRSQQRPQRRQPQLRRNRQQLRRRRLPLHPRRQLAPMATCMAFFGITSALSRHAKRMAPLRHIAISAESISEQPSFPPRGTPSRQRLSSMKRKQTQKKFSSGWKK